MYLTPERLDHKLYLLRGNTLDGFLYDVVTILILDTLENIGVQLAGKLGLLIGEDMFECLLEISPSLKCRYQEKITF